VTDGGWKELLTLLLSQRLAINALESALKTAGILADAQVREIRTQTSDTAKAWSSKDCDDTMSTAGASRLTARGHLTAFRYHPNASLLPNRIRNSPVGESVQQRPALVGLVHSDLCQRKGVVV
jgi:hypothetical protein